MGRRIRTAQGWISVDRGGKATLPLTIPRRVFKSSAKDSTRRPHGIALLGGLPRLIRRVVYAYDMGRWGQMAPTVGRGADDEQEHRSLAWILT